MNKKGRFHKGSIAGLRAWGIARLLEVMEAAGSGKGNKKDKKVSNARVLFCSNAHTLVWQV